MMWLLFQKQIEKLIELSELYVSPQLSEKHLFYFCYTSLTKKNFHCFQYYSVCDMYVH